MPDKKICSVGGKGVSDTFFLLVISDTFFLVHACDALSAFLKTFKAIDGMGQGGRLFCDSEIATGLPAHLNPDCSFRASYKGWISGYIHIGGENGHWLRREGLHAVGNPSFATLFSLYCDDRVLHRVVGAE